MTPKKMYVCEIFNRIGGCKYSYKVLEEANNEKEAFEKLYERLSNFEKKELDNIAVREVVYANSKT